MSAPPVMVAMSGGVDSSVAAALLLAEGSEVVGVTLRLWGGESDSGCCAVSDVDDARRVCDALGIEHHVFNLGDDFDRHVVAPYVSAHAAGLTPNPCIECNRHVKFDRLLDRTRALGFERLATGHHARVVVRPDGTRRIARPADPAKDQSYVLHMLGQDQLSGLELPIGDLTKDEVRQRATSLGLRTAGKPDSQDVCFITREHGRGDFLSRRIPLTPGRVVDATGTEVGRVDAIELVTVGQRRGMELAGAAAPRYAIAVDMPTATVTVGNADDLLVDATPVGGFSWADGPVTGPVLAQVSAHGAAVEAQLVADSVRWSSPHRRVAPGQSVVFYEGEEVLGGAVAT
ncbi:MAG TPA: tRNA 2-thiouridine(34) synthase MnmA [Acidimicrobiales bacterium]|nr:tRNA 2-thiouridine(34) synthase MnmA [Acidimicrobiales bacterium]